MKINKLLGIIEKYTHISYTITMEKYYYVLQNDSYIKRELTQSMTFLDAKIDAGNRTAICALRNQELESLTKKIEYGDYVQFLSSTQSERASRVFLRGATMLLHVAANELNIEFTVEHVLYGGIFCKLRNPCSDNIKKLQAKIDEYIEDDEDFSFTMVDIERAKELLAKENLTEQVRLLKFRPFDYFRLYWFKEHCGYYHGIMPPSSSYLKCAKLTQYQNGFVLRVPTPYRAACRSIEDQKKYLNVFTAAERWAESMNSSYIADLNEHYLSGRIEDIVKANEELHESEIGDIAQTILSDKRIRIVLIAGPSSSGKTTFANRLSQKLYDSGTKTLRISIDDYYKDRDDVPYDESGEQDFESLGAIDTSKLEQDITDLLSGKQVFVPIFDFASGKRRDEGIATKIDHDIVIVEGIHGLNDKLLRCIEKSVKYKIFIAPLTALNFDRRSVVLPEDLRLLRRLARDKRTRGFSFSDTFAMWKRVRKGEYKYILPYQETADVMFNSTLVYEPLVLKKYCYEDLQNIPKTDPGYIRAQSMLKFLNYFLSLDDENSIPKNSLLREFIGQRI